MIICNDCRETVTGKYCSNCGEPQTLKRIDAKYIVHEFTHVLHFEHGFPYTTKQLLFSPGETVRKYIEISRSKIVKPILYIIVTSLVYSFFAYFFPLPIQPQEVELSQSSATVKIFSWITTNFGYSNILMGLFIAMWTKLFFRKHKYNFYEIVVLLCYVMGVGMLIFSLFVVLQGILHNSLLEIASVVTFAYVIWAIGDFFDKRKVASYLKAFAAYVIGMITALIFALVIGLAIDLYFNNTIIIN